MMRRTSLASLAACALLSCGGGSDGSSGDEVLGTQETAPAPVLVKALDISVYSGTISSVHVEQWKAAGFSHVIVGCQNTSVAKQQLGLLMAGGMTVDVYKYLYFTSSMTTQVQMALAIAEGFPVGRLWLDLEADPGSLDVYGIVDRIQEAIDAAGTMPVGIYTGWFWRDHMQGCAEFSDLPLWTARYDGIQNFDFWKEKWFGGWTMPTGKQYMGDTTVGGNGVDVDTNILWINAGSGPPPPAGVPDPPSGLAPDGTTVTTSSAKLTWSDESATKYQILMQYGNPGAWKYYWTWTSSTPTFTVWPQQPGKQYRWRVRAQNAVGWSAWSSWAQFYFP